MKVGIIGFGKTGKAVASVLLKSEEANVQWVIRQSEEIKHRSAPKYLRIKSDQPGLIYSSSELSASELLDRHPVDIIVDFSSESGLDYYGTEAAKRGVTIISAISEYSDEKTIMLSQLAEKTCVLHSANITLGINFLIIAAKVLKDIAPHCDIEIIEKHFKNKPEVSGTAKVIANELNLPTEDIKTIRAGGIVGVHQVLFGFPNQTVRIKHESITREAFGGGILFAMKNLKGKPNGLYSMEDLMQPYFQMAA